MTDPVISSTSVKVVQFNKNEEVTEDIFSGTSSFSGLKTFLCPEIENIQIRSNFIFVCITPSLFGVKFHLHSCQQCNRKADVCFSLLHFHDCL